MSEDIPGHGVMLLMMPISWNLEADIRIVFTTPSMAMRMAIGRSKTIILAVEMGS
jgi:hypothetical protein